MYRNIRLRREELGITQEDLAKKLGYKSRSSINKIELGINDLPQSKVKEFADALDITVSRLMGWDGDIMDNGAVNPYASEQIRPISVQKVPLLGNVAAGQPILAEEDFECYVEIGADIKCDFCLRVKGDSMINARINDGDIVFIRKQPDVNDGEIACVVVDDEATLKRVYKSNECITLVAENPKYKPIIILLDDSINIHILGKAVAFQSDVK